MKAGAGIKTIAIKVCEEDFDEKRALALNILNGVEVYTEPGLSVFRLQDGCLMHLYGPGSSYPPYLFEKNKTVLSFQVKDIEKAIASAKCAGMEIISEIQKLGICISYCYLRDKKGTIFGLTN